MAEIFRLQYLTPVAAERFIKVGAPIKTKKYTGGRVIRITSSKKSENVCPFHRKEYFEFSGKRLSKNYCFITGNHCYPQKFPECKIWRYISDLQKRVITLESEGEKSVVKQDVEFIGIVKIKNKLYLKYDPNKDNGCCAYFEIEDEDNILTDFLASGQR